MNIPVLLLAALLQTASAAHAAKDQATAAPSAEAEGAAWDARITEVEGDVVLFAGGAEEGLPAEAGHPLEPGDRLETGPGSRVELALEADSVMELGPRSSFVVESLRPADSSFELSLGSFVAKLRSMLERGYRVRVRTPTAVAAVRGTEFALAVADDGETSVGVFDEGQVAVKAEGASVEETVLQAREETLVPRGPGLETTRRDGRTFLKKGDLSRLGADISRLERLRARRAVLRRGWQALTPAKRAGLRRQSAQRYLESLRKLKPEQKRALLRKMKARALLREGPHKRRGLQEPAGAPAKGARPDQRRPAIKVKGRDLRKRSRRDR